MNRKRYFTLPALVLSSILSTSAQQNSTQETVSSVVTCVSTGDQRQHCAADTSAGVVMLRPTGETSCLLGRNWGYDAQGVWVSEGCGGEFATGSISRSTKVYVQVNAYTATADQSPDLATVTTGTNPAVDYFGMFNPYGSLRNIVSISDSGAQVQDNASRMGINFSTFGPIKVFATGEWGVNLVRSETTFNAGASTDQGFGVISQGTQSVFNARLRFPRRQLRPVWKPLFRQRKLYPLRHSGLYDGSLQRVWRHGDHNLCGGDGWRAIWYWTR